MRSYIVVKRTERETPRKMKILFATDGSASAVETARFLSAMPFYSDFEITILNVQWSVFFDIPERFAMEVDDRMKETFAYQRKGEREKSEKILGEAKSYLTGKYENLQTMIKFGDPSSEILSAAGQLQADIIAVGCRGLKRIKSMREVFPKISLYIKVLRADRKGTLKLPVTIATGSNSCEHMTEVEPSRFCGLVCDLRMPTLSDIVRQVR